MGKRKKKSSCEDDHTWSLLLMALFSGACAVMTMETIAEDVIESFGRQTGKLAGWQFHMGSACAGIITFSVVLFILELLETRSKKAAFRSTSPWLPLVGLTAIATVVQIPFYVVALIGTIYGVWAYRRTSSVRRLARLP